MDYMEPYTDARVQEVLNIPTLERVASLSDRFTKTAISGKRGGFRTAKSNPASTYNVLIVGEGYTEFEEPLFRADVANLTQVFTDPSVAIPSWIEHILNESNLRGGDRYVKDLRFYVPDFAWTSSTDSGIDEIERKTHFAVSYTPHPWFTINGMVDRSMLTGQSVYEKANDLRRLVRDTYLGRPLMQRVLILTNSSQRGAGHTGGALIVPGGYENSFKLFEHELGHALGLGDEYWVEGHGLAGTPPDGFDYPYPNVSKFPNGLVRLAADGTLIQKAINWPEDEDREGNRKGALYTEHAYRPAEQCIMRDAEFPNFCPVCEAHLVDFFTLRSGTPDFAVVRLHNIPKIIDSFR